MCSKSTHIKIEQLNELSQCEHPQLKTYYPFTKKCEIR